MNGLSARVTATDKDELSYHVTATFLLRLHQVLLHDTLYWRHTEQRDVSLQQGKLQIAG